MSNIEEVVKNRLCLCCGTCAAVCPRDAIRMEETAVGLLHARVNDSACNNCGLCLKVCPGSHLEKGLLSPQTDPFRGNVISAYCGRANDENIRQNGQSGGIVTALLRHLLDSGVVSKAVVSQMPQDGSLRPRCIVTSQPDEIRKSQGSLYCPVALGSAAQKTIANSGEKIAVVGLACHLHGLENARTHLKNPSPVKIGLVCDRMLAYGAIDYLISKADVDRESVAFFQFRSKKFNGWPGDVCVRTKDGKDICVANKHRMTIKDFYTPVRCRLCFDKMNSLCDIVVGDAWGVRQDKQGFSVIITRSDRGQQAVSSAQKAGAIVIEKVNAEKIFKGQAVEDKRRDWTQFTAAWRQMKMSAPNFNFDEKWYGNIEGLDSTPHRNKINLAINLENMTDRKEVLEAAKREVAMNKKYSSLQGSKLIRIVGGGFSNKGAEAMLLVVSEAIRRRLAGADILARLHEEDFEQARDNGINLLEMPPSRVFIRQVMAAIMPKKIRYRAGAVIDIGGYQFGDDWGPKSAYNKLKMVKRWIRAGEPVFFMPQAWGPFSTEAINEPIREIINTATLSFARDRTSLRQLQKIAGADNPKLRFAHDIAWNFQGADLSVGEQLLSEAGISKKDKVLTVCLTPNLQVYKRSKGRGPDNEYIKSLCDITGHLCLAHNARVVLLEHQFSQGNPDEKNDRTLCKYILGSLDGSLPVVHLDKALSAGQIKSVIGNCDLLLSSRYHALIAGLSQQIPAVAIGWSHKYDELMTEVGLSSNVISLPKPKDEITGELDVIIGRITQAKNVLATTIGPMKQSGQKALDEVLSIIQERFQS